MADPKLETTSHTLKSSLDPTSINEIETPEPQPDEYSDDFEVDPSIPDTIAPELLNPKNINSPGLDPSEDEAEPEEDSELDPEGLEDLPPDADLPTPDEPEADEVIRQEN